MSGADTITSKASSYATIEPLKALHLIDIVLENEASNKDALNVRKTALSQLLEAAKAGDKNSYEIYWLNYRVRDTQSKLDAQ